ncbi:hypothetical protein ACFQQB_15820 [Nonomuraea rubra]|uniref:hypothetical protein n=1 Tax=Nonomuraea rubra TaxID=46180 RepID=UPI00360C9056
MPPTGSMKICVSTPGERPHRSILNSPPQATQSRPAPTSSPNPATARAEVTSSGAPVRVSTAT